VHTRHNANKRDTTGHTGRGATYVACYWNAARCERSEFLQLHGWCASCSSVAAHPSRDGWLHWEFDFSFARRQSVSTRLECSRGNAKQPLLTTSPTLSPFLLGITARVLFHHCQIGALAARVNRHVINSERRILCKKAPESYEHCRRKAQIRTHHADTSRLVHIFRGHSGGAP